MPETLAVTICATEKYQYAMKPQARIIHANLRAYEGQIRIILVGDEKLKDIADYHRELWGLAGGKEDGRVQVITFQKFRPAPGANYKQPVQLLISQMRTWAFTKARSLGADFCWSLDSDVIPKNSTCLRALRWLLDMPDRFYGVAISPYPSQGGGDFLTGRGAPERPIFSDFDESERALPPDLAAQHEKLKADFKAAGPTGPSKELLAQADKIRQEIEKCPAKGNIFAMNAAAWRRRGWMSAAYPALGRGTIVPTDWCGFGNTLMGRRALDETDFLGYDGGGTEDLFAIFNRWHQVGLRIGSILHEPSAHVSRRADGKYFVAWPRFVTESDAMKGECVDHLRIQHKPFYSSDPNEAWDEKNDGHPQAPSVRDMKEDLALDEGKIFAKGTTTPAPSSPQMDPPPPPAQGPYR